MRRVLVLAYYFPPMGLSGVQRTAKFVKYLPKTGWQPTVLTVRPGGYYAFDDDLLAEVQHTGAEIQRTRSFDPTQLFGHRRQVEMPGAAKRRLWQTIRQLVFVPDSKIGWLLPALLRGRQLLRQAPYDAIFSTAPPYTSHLVGAALSRLTRTPLVLDFRDDWLETTHHSYPTRLHHRLHASLERAAIDRCAAAVTINTYIRDALARRHPSADSRIAVIPHGFDAEDFMLAPDRPGPAPSREASSEHMSVLPAADKMTLLYSGVFYDQQTPDSFLRGAARLLEEHPEITHKLRLVFVGHFPEAYKPLIARLGLSEHVVCAGYRPHAETVRALQVADVLWMTVGRQEGEEQVSTSKLFEYFGSRKPVLGLVPPGAARDALEAYGAGVAVAPDDPSAVAATLRMLYEQWQKGRLPQPREPFVRRHERGHLAQQLADLLEQSAKVHDA